MISRKNIFTSGWEFKKSETDLQSRFQMINIALLTSSISLFFAILSNVYKVTYDIIPLEIFIISLNGVFFLLLRRYKYSFTYISSIIAAQYAFFFLYLYYAYPPDSLKFIWFFTYPIILLYFQEKKYAKNWMVFVITMILIAPLQSFTEVYFTLFQAIYFAGVLMVVTLIILFYQNKMDEAKDTILRQQEMLKVKVDELTQKDRLLTVQSKQAVMGEMISMIAHQWRQPLSTVTLSISNLQVQKMLGTKIEDDFLDKKLQEISDTVVYLSETIDDFQTYFSPNKNVSDIAIGELVSRAINFTKARLDGTTVSLVYEGNSNHVVQTYANELVQVILNILNNAIDELISQRTKTDGKITVRLQEIGDAFFVEIEDNGRGITNENLESIFEPYYSTKGKNGTGLGLYMSQMIMQKQFNSKIEVKSSQSGTCFTIKVPKKLA